MANIVWSIQYVPTGEEKTCAAWGVSDLSLRFQNQGADTLTVVRDGAAIDEASIWEYGQECILKRDGVRWFVGRVNSNPRTGSAQSESVSYTLAGPWWYLEQAVFEQIWQVKDEEGALQPVFKGRAILGQGSTGDRITNGGQISEAIQLLIDRGAPITKGTIEPALFAPFQEVKDLSVSEVVMAQMKWTPNATAWFDYSTIPNPTFHVTERGNMGVASIAIGSVNSPSSLQLTPRYDLRVPCVLLKYEAENNIDGSTSTSLIIDKWPAEASGTEWGTLCQTMELGGASKTLQRQQVKAETILQDSPTWWKQHIPSLSQITGLVVKEHSAHVTSATEGKVGGLPRELISGSAPSWITTSDTYKVRVSAIIQGIQKNKELPAKIIKTHEDTPVEVILMGTDLSDRTYARTAAATEAEQPPANLAQNLYEALDVLHWEGSVVMVEQECTGVLRPGKLLNITQGHAAWATMGAQIQQVTEDVFSGSTTARFGPPEHLSPQDFIELLRLTQRPTSFRVGERTSGQPDTPMVDGGTATAIQLGGEIGAGEVTNIMPAPGTGNENTNIKDDVAGSSDSGGKATRTTQHKSGGKSVTVAESGTIYTIVSYAPGDPNDPLPESEIKITANAEGAEVTTKGGSTEEAPKITYVSNATTSYILIEKGEISISISLDDVPEGVTDVKLREVDWCDPATPDTPKKRLILCSEVYEAGA